MTHKTTPYDAVKVSEYLGKFTIEAHKVVKDKTYAIWAKYQKSKDEFQDKSWPVKVVLGDKEQALAVLKTMIKEIESGNLNEEEVMF